MIDRLREIFSPEQHRIIGAEAQQLLDNKHFQEAFQAVESYLVESAKTSNPDDRDKSQRIVISMQLLEAVKREIVRKVEDGEVAKVEIEELERRNRPLRFVR